MKNVCLLTLVLAAILATGCAFENSSKVFPPTAPSGNAPAGGTSGGSSNAGSGSGGGSNAASAFAGSWGSSTIAGLPLGSCSDVKWLITAQTATSIGGTVTANCASGVKVAATLTGALQGEHAIDLAATGTITAMGLPCQFNLSGTGTRQRDDTMKVNYKGTHCLGTINGSETLRKFPNL